MKRLLYALILLVSLTVASFGQTPGTSQFPTSLDTNTTLLTAVNGCQTTLNGAINNSTTALTVASQTCFPSTGVFAVESEYFIYTASTATTFTVTRGAFGSTAASHANGTAVRLSVIAAYHNALKAGLIATQTKLGYGSDTAASDEVLVGTGAGQSGWAKLVNANVSASAAIDATKIGGGAVSNTEFGYLDGVTSAIQTQINALSSGLNPTGSSTTNGDITLVGQAVSGGDVLLDLTPAASTGIATETPNFVVRAATQTTSATITNYRFNQFLAPTLASSSSRTTDAAATLYVNDAPIAGSNMTITNPLAFWVGAGNTRLDGFLAVGANPVATTQLYVAPTSSGNVGIRVDGGTNANILVLNRSTTPQLVVNNVGFVAHTPTASTSGAVRFNIVTAADTTLGTSTESPYVRIGGDASGATVTRQFNSGALTTQREHLFVHPTYSFTGSSTLTNAATVAITNAPAAGTNATITNAAALWVQAGLTRLDGTLTVGGGSTISKVLTGSASLNFGATAAGTCDVLTISVTGAADGDTVFLGLPDALASADNYQSFHAWVSAADTVSVKRCNLTNAVTALSNPAAATVKVTVLQ